MAVYEGARPRTVLLPRRRLEPLVRRQAPALPRRRQHIAIRARRRPRTVGLVLGGISVAFILAFFSLVQTVRVSASGYDAGRLGDEYRTLLQQRQQVESQLDRVGGEPAIRHEAIRRGLTELPAPIVLPAP